MGRGREITRADLDQTLKDHKLWLESHGKEGKKADLSKANLSGANLDSANLTMADLSGANLSGANLGGAKLLEANLSRVILFHANLSGAKLNGSDLSGADLSEANLSEANLSKAKLSGANLRGADLIKADLSGADLILADLGWASLGGANLSKAWLLADLSGAELARANLSGAHLEGANLNGADLLGADLSGAELGHANLIGADLSDADLSGAKLSEAKLSKAKLSGANLSGADLIKADLRGATFEPKPGKLPGADGLLYVQGLDSLKFVGNLSYGLMELREIFKKAGMLDDERQVNYALNHNRRVNNWKEKRISWLGNYFQLVFFEWTCDYGMTPSRPLELIFLGLFVFTFPYFLALRTRDPETGIWLLLPSDRVLDRKLKDHPIKLTTRTPFRPLPENRWARCRAYLRRGWRRLRLAFYFSLLSAFYLGWRELNVGNWISRLQKREYNLRATGWVRTVSCIQSLLSVYMLALWLLTYFSRPFE